MINYRRLLKKIDQIRGHAEDIVLQVNVFLGFLTSMVYPIIFKGQEFLADLWYCLMYLSLFLYAWIFRHINKWFYYVMLIFVARLIYNTLILLKILEYDKSESSFSVPIFISIIFIINEWHKLRIGLYGNGYKK